MTDNSKKARFMHHNLITLMKLGANLTECSQVIYEAETNELVVKHKGEPPQKA